MTIDEMIEELVEEYESAGYADFYERELKGKSDIEIKKIYENFKKWCKDSEKEYQKERDTSIQQNEANNE